MEITPDTTCMIKGDNNLYYIGLHMDLELVLQDRQRVISVCILLARLATAGNHRLGRQLGQNGSQDSKEKLVGCRHGNTKLSTKTTA